MVSQHLMTKGAGVVTASALELQSRRVARMPGAWPLLGHAPALLRDPLGFLAAAYQAGDVVALRLGPKAAYLINGQEALKQILVADAARYDKGFQFDQLRRLMGDGVGTTADPAKHRRQRRLLRPAFDHARVETYVSIMARAAQEASRRWPTVPSIDAGAEMRALSMSVVARAMFDVGAGSSDESPAARTVLAAFPTLVAGMGRRAILPIRLLDRLPTRGNRAFDRALSDLNVLADRMIAERRAAAAADPAVAHTGRCLLDTILAARDDDLRGMTDEQVHDEIMTVLLAGTETTAGTLAWILHVLADDPELQGEVQREADQVAGASLPSPGDLGAMLLTRRVVAEVLRLYPAGWILGRRPMQDTTVADATIPAGAQVLLNFYGVQRDPEIYPDPDRFDPGRWRDGETDPPRPHFLPFGLGPHVCLGEGFAMSQILATVAVVFSRYAVRPVPGSAVRPVARVTLHPGVVPLIVEER
jgi:cytochrome P450